MKQKKILIIFAVFAIGVAIYFIYAFSGNKNQEIKEEITNTIISEKIEDECTEEYIQEQAKVVTATQEKVAPNAILILKKYYTKCEHTLNEYVELPQEIVNMTKEDVEKQYKDWEVIGFSPQKVTLYKEFDDVCGEHYKLRIENGKVIINIINDDGREELYEKTNISSEYLTETDLINMQDGLEIYGKEELNKIIEDFE